MSGLAYVRALLAEDPLRLMARFRHGIAWNLAAALFKQGGTFAAGIVIANMLGRELFGQYAIVLTMVQAIAVVAGLGMGYTATKYVAEFRTSDPERAGRVLGLCSLTAMLSAVGLGVVILFAAPYFAAGLLHAPQLTTPVRIAAVIIAAATLAGFFAGALAGLEAYRSMGRAAVATGVIHVAAAALLTWLLGLTGAVLALLAASTFQMLLLGRLMVVHARAQSVSLRFRGLTTERRVLLVFALPGALAGLTATPALWLAQVWLSRHPHGFAQLGLYSAAYSCMAIVLLVPYVANNVGMSLLNNLLGTKRDDDYRRMFWTNLAVTALLVVLAAVGPLLLGMFGPGFGEAYVVLLILLAATMPEGVTIACNQVLQSREKMWHAMLLINVPRDSLLVLLAWYIAPVYGATGLAICYLAARLVACALMIGAVMRIGVVQRRPGIAGLSAEAA
jgi:O-antigen/teichoic acid export membrane protein